MIITRTPLRISFLGGGTDYPAYFRQHGGATLATTIDKYTYVTVSSLTEFFDHRVGVYYSRVERVKNLDEIEHPSVRECLRFLHIEHGVEIHIASDLPARTGLGSSSSFTVGLLKALHAFKGEMIGAEQLAREAVYVEQNMIRERIGCQDQYSCAHGGLLHLKFDCDGRISVTPVVLNQDRFQELQQRLMLFYTGIQRTAHEILEEQIERTRSGQINAELKSIGTLVEQGMHLFSNSTELAELGTLLHEGWMLKRRCSAQISNSFIDELYGRARATGAIGGKLLGAGGGGFLLLYVEPDRQSHVRQALPELRQVNFSFDNSGSTIVFYRP